MGIMGDERVLVVQWACERKVSRVCILVKGW